MSKTLEAGRRAEEAAALYLEQKGYRILEHHYSCRGGEIDLIAYKEGCLTFAEVKYRSTDRFGRPEEAITQSKILALSRACASYIAEHQAEQPYRYSFDVLAVSGPRWEIRHYPNAFTPVGLDF